MSTAASAPACTSGTTKTGTSTSTSSNAAAAATGTPAPSTKSNNNQDSPKSTGTDESTNPATATVDAILEAASAATNVVRALGKASGALDGTTGTHTASSHTTPKPHLPVLIIPGFMSR